MQLFSVKKSLAILRLFLVLSTCLSATCSLAAESHNIHIEWTYDISQDTPVDGFRLYKENSAVCHTSDPTTRAMDCTFESPAGTFDFYLSAYSENSESPLSAPFPFTLQASEPPVAEISANISSGELPLTVILDAGNSQGEITQYIWSFGDNTGNIWTTSNHTTHTYYTAGQYTATVTVVDSNNNSDTNSLTIEATSPEVPPGLTAPTATIRTSGNSGTAPFSVSFDGLASTAGSGEISKFIWNFDDGTRRTWGETAVHTYSIPGTYHPTLTVINSDGLVDSTSVTIVVTNTLPDNESPTADFTHALIQQDDTLIIEFDASISTDNDGQIVSYVWNFENNILQTGSKVTHTFPVNRVHSISLTVTDDSGSQDTKSMSTITFLKDIHAAVVNHINSLLLKKDKDQNVL